MIEKFNEWNFHGLRQNIELAFSIRKLSKHLDHLRPSFKTIYETILNKSDAKAMAIIGLLLVGDYLSMYLM